MAPASNIAPIYSAGNYQLEDLCKWRSTQNLLLIPTSANDNTISAFYRGSFSRLYHP